MSRHRVVVLTIVVVAIVLAVSPAAGPQKPPTGADQTGQREGAKPKRDVTLQAGPTDPWVKDLVKKVADLQDKVKELEAQLEGLPRHRHEYEDANMGGSHWVTIDMLREAVEDDEYPNLNGYGIYFRAQPFPAGHKAARKMTELPTR